MPITLLLYLLLINLLGFILYGLDKAKSKRKGSRRIPERTLLWVARLGGGVGCWLSMMLFRHKTQHTRFMILVPLWTVLWAVGVVLLWRYGSTGQA
jgi:uncharacterized membrane protein YsdA (DUF1294 family)